MYTSGHIESNLAIDSEVIEDMIKTCDKNGDGFIDYKEFVENISKR
jgi:Ca2+-binding EF-hand superfamily protein